MILSQKNDISNNIKNNLEKIYLEKCLGQASDVLKVKLRTVS